MGSLFNLRRHIFRRKRINLIHNDFCFTAVLVPANHVSHLVRKVKLFILASHALPNFVAHLRPVHSVAKLSCVVIS